MCTEELDDGSICHCNIRRRPGKNGDCRHCGHKAAAHEFEPSAAVPKRTKPWEDKYEEIMEKYSEPLQRLRVQAPKTTEAEARKETNAGFRPKKSATRSTRKKPSLKVKAPYIKRVKLIHLARLKLYQLQLSTQHLE